MLDSFETLNSSLLTKNIIIKTINPNIESEIVNMYVDLKESDNEY